MSLIAFLAVLVEGSVTDWSALYMSSEVGAPGDAAAIGFSDYALMMIAGRLLGDGIVRAVDRTRVILYGAVLLFVGIGLATGPVSEPTAIVGFALVGLGVANMVPAAFSASAAAASSPSLGVARAATMAYPSLLVGPPLFGAIATLSSLRLAFAILLLAAIGIAALAATQHGPGMANASAEPEPISD